MDTFVIGFKGNTSRNTPTAIQIMRHRKSLKVENRGPLHFSCPIIKSCRTNQVSFDGSFRGKGGNSVSEQLVPEHLSSSLF